MSQEIKLFPHLSAWQTRALFFPQIMDWLHSLIPVGSHSVPVLIEAGMVLFLELICVQGLLYTWIFLEAFNFLSAQKKVI